MPQNKEKLKQEGQVIKTLPNAFFGVRLDNGQEILAHLSGKIRLNFIQIVLGDRVLVEVSPYDATKGRIIRRL